MFEGEKCKNHIGFFLVSDDDLGATHEVDYNSLERVLGCHPRLRGARMRILTNDRPSPTCPTRRRSGRFSSVGA